MTDIIWRINSAIGSVFNLLISPFKSLSPIWSLTFFSLLIGILMLVIFRYTSDQKGIREVKSKIRAYIFELSLYKNELGVVLSAQKNIFVYNLKYIKYALIPMMFMIIPLALILIQLESWYGYRPLSPEESAIVSLTFGKNGHSVPSDISLETTAGITVETPPLRIPSERQVDWRIRADTPGDHELMFNVDGQTLKQPVIVSDKGLMRVMPSVFDSGEWESVLNPVQKPLSGDPRVERIEVKYPSNSISIYHWHVHWLVVVLVLSIVFGFALKGLFRVEI